MVHDCLPVLQCLYFQYSLQSNESLIDNFKCVSLPTISICLSTCIYVCLHVHVQYVSVCPLVTVSVCQSICLSTGLQIFVCLCLLPTLHCRSLDVDSVSSLIILYLNNLF